MNPGWRTRHGPQAAGFVLVLADGSRFCIRAGDEAAARVVACFAASAGLAPAPGPPSTQQDTRQAVGVLVVTEGQAMANSAAGDAVCRLRPPGRWWERQPAGGRAAALVPRPLSETEWLWLQLVRLSAFLGKEAQAHGGVLLHGGLAVHPGPSGPHGVLLAGPSGVGKSTASRRLPRPWHSLSDDQTLIVPDQRGTYWAHPWPTWSRFFDEQDRGDEGSDTWQVQQAVPLRAILILEQAGEDRAEPLGPGHAVCVLAELARQTSTHLLQGWPRDELATFHLQRFENLCALARSVPTYRLQVSRHGTFWEEIERALC